MLPTTLLSTASLLLLLPVSALGTQVNFYWDDNCTPEQFAGKQEPGLQEVAGGPFGARSMYWVAGPNNCIRSLPHMRWCRDNKCENSERAQIGECKHYEDGNWAMAYCGPGATLLEEEL